MGYDVERFLGNVNDGLLCCICKDVLEHPLQAPCEHVYCGLCIHGWLSHQSNCPVDRRTLTATDLRELHRYMRNDLSQLQIRCQNQRRGCKMVCSLESIDKHERECEFSHMSCINAGCTVRFERRHLESHLAVCEHQRRECPNGCGYTMLSTKDIQHNCIAELRTGLEILRSEMDRSIEVTKKEIKSIQDSMRQVMAQRESLLQAQRELKEMKVQMFRLQFDVQTLKTSERQRQIDLEKLKQEKQEQMERMKGLQRKCGTKSHDETHSPASGHPLPLVESLLSRTKEFRGQISGLKSDVANLKAIEKLLLQDLEQVNLEHQKLREMKGLQQEHITKRSDESHKPSSSHPLPPLESLKRRPRQVTHTGSMSEEREQNPQISSTSKPLNGPAPPLIPNVLNKPSGSKPPQI